MAEIGAKPNVPRFQRAALRAVRALSTPLLTDDYLELINPLWSTRELRGRIERIDHVTDDAATVMIKPVNRWEGHRAGQYVRIGVEIRGVWQWRAYSLTSEQGAGAEQAPPRGRHGARSSTAVRGHPRVLPSALAWIACHTRSPFTGISSWRTPNGASASITALWTAGVEPIVPASPIPLAPRALTGVGVSIATSSNDGSALADGMQ